MRSEPSAAILPEPPVELKQLSQQLLCRMRAKADDDGFLSFEQYMEMALYEPCLGYYSAGLHKLGASGDFVTAPELGEVFGQCLARQIAEIAQRLGDWRMLEIGAGTGKLAATLLQALEPELQPKRYCILERSADLRQQQVERLTGFAVEWLDAPPDQPWKGIVLANEVMDALAVERFSISEAGLEQVGVDTTAALKWTTRPAPGPLAESIGLRLGDRLGQLPIPYVSEICTQLPAWLNSVTSSLEQGVVLLIDYGYPGPEYYRAERRDGTLLCHYRHRAHGDPFWWPGLQDLTAFVDFTSVAEAGLNCGLDYAGYTSQSQFLLACGLDRVLADLESLPQKQRLEKAREVRQLTMPDAMGEKFQVMGLSRGYANDLRGFRGQDLGRYL